MKEDLNIHDEASRERLVNDRLKTPDGYFASLNQCIRDRIAEEHEPEETYFEEQKQHLLALAAIAAADNKADEAFRVPEGYFESASTAMLQTVHAQKQKPLIRRIQPILWSSAAAAAAVLIAVYWLHTSSPEQASFEALLAQADLNENDLEWIAEADELADYYIALDENLALDSLLPDTAEMKVVALDTLVTPPPAPKAQPGKTPTVDWDDLTDEEIMDYLMESGDAEEWID